MRPLGTFAVVLFTSAAAAASPARAGGESRTALFEEAVRDDLGSAEAAPHAYALYRAAAEAGLPAAQLNVGIMLDAGRGVARNIAEAATWYARAAVHGSPRAAYNLGQLYASGDGVPLNPDLARAWFAASQLPAGLERVRARLSRASNLPLSGPALILPRAGAAVRVPDQGAIELVWTSQPQPEPVHFFVEVRRLDGTNSREVFSGFTDTSGVLADLPGPGGTFAWRVMTIGRAAGRYVTSDWQRFSIGDD